MRLLSSVNIPGVHLPLCEICRVGFSRKALLDAFIRYAKHFAREFYELFQAVLPHERHH